MSTTSVKVFASTDPGAIVLSGTAGALSTLLKTHLVDGSGLQSVATLTVASGIATATYSAGHPFVEGRVALIAGATPAGLNGEKRIISVATNSVTFAAQGVLDGAATGSITSKLAPAGWQQVFSGTNIACLKPAVPEATGCVLRVDDTGTLNARVRAYEAMTDADTGIGPTPMNSQVSGGLYWPKSSTNNSTGRPWFLVADDRCFYLAVAPQGGDRHTLLYSGDIASLKSGDPYGYLITGNLSDMTSSGSTGNGCCGYSRRGDTSGAYLARMHTGIGQSVAAQRIGAHHTGASQDIYAGTPGYAWGTYPNGPNNGLMTGALELFAGGIRGTLPGLLHPVQDCGNMFSSGTMVDGTDDLAGRRLLALRVGPPAGGTTGTVFLDATGPWSR